MPALPAITSSLAATGTNGAGFGYQITAGNSPTGFAASGLPAGLSVDPIYGVIYGVPAAAGAFNATIAAINSGGANFKTLAITIAQMPAPTIQAAFTTLHNFAFAEGANPACGLSTGADGNLYGAAQNGGYYWYGSLFKITPSGILTTLQSFDSTDGQTPSAPPIQAATGNFYGATEDGGANGGGEIYELTSSGSLNVLYSFGGTYGAPADPLLNGTDGNLWGTSQTGGSHDAGSIFKITPAGSFTTEHSFNTGGTNPVGGLITGTDGNLYGTTEWGGTDGDGTVFKMSYRGTFTTLVNFNWSNGAYPLSGLIQASDGNFYGAANSGGLYGAGAVFKMTASGSVSDLCSFTGTYGEYPVCGVIQGQDGNFYGTTIGGGANGYGTIYSVTPGGTLTVLHSFSGSDGGLPEGSLVQLSNGVMYGATSQGGGGTYGTVYAVSPMTVRGQAGSAFSYEINAVSNTAPSSYTATGLPAGLSVNSSTGLISGTPVNAGTTTVTISATNPGGTGAGPLVIAVAPGPPVITSAASVTGTCGDAFDYPVTAGGSPSRYNETGLPPGLSISASTGVISGTPSAAGTYQATISAGNTLGAGSAGLSLTIKAAFAGWQSQWFTSAQLANPSISAEFAAAAGDGIPNLLKYAFNLGPYANAAPSLPLLSHTGLTGASYLTLTYIQDIFASDITYTPQVSPDLHNWFSGSAYINVLSVTPDSDGVTERVTVQDLTPMGSAPRYMRLEVTGP